MADKNKKIKSRDTCVCCFVVFVTPSEDWIMGLAAGMTRAHKFLAGRRKNFLSSNPHKSQNTSTDQIENTSARSKHVSLKT